jgi:hypothetical protein
VLQQREYPVVCEVWRKTFIVSIFEMGTTKHTPTHRELGIFKNVFLCSIKATLLALYKTLFPFYRSKDNIDSSLRVI